MRHVGIIFYKDVNFEEVFYAPCENSPTERTGNLNHEKCQVARGAINFHGYVAGYGAHLPDSNKHCVIEGLDPPCNKTELQSVVGLLHTTGSM